MGTLCVKICSLDKGERECAKFLIVKRLMCQNILLLDTCCGMQIKFHLCK